MARHEKNFDVASEVDVPGESDTLAHGEALARFLCGGEGWIEAARSLRGAFAPTDGDGDEKD